MTEEQKRRGIEKTAERLYESSRASGKNPNLIKITEMVRQAVVRSENR